MLQQEFQRYVQYSQGLSASWGQKIPLALTWISATGESFSWALPWWLYEKWKWKSLSRVWLFVTPWIVVHGILQVGSLSLLQGICPTQGSNLGLPHCRWMLYQLSHKWSPRILEWKAYPFSSGSSCPRNWTRVFCIEGGFFPNWAIRMAVCRL